MAQIQRKNYTSGTKWENEVGYSRAVKAGNHIYVSGTTAVDDEGKIVGLGSAYLQTRFCIQKIEHALKELGAGLENVVRTRMYTVVMQDWEEIGKAHGEFFRKIKPASTLVEVKNLIDVDLLIEIEVEAVIDE